MVTFRAICCIHCSVGWVVIPAISTCRLARWMVDRISAPYSGETEGSLLCDKSFSAKGDRFGGTRPKSAADRSLILRRFFLRPTGLQVQILPLRPVLSRILVQFRHRLRRSRSERATVAPSRVCYELCPGLSLRRPLTATSARKCAMRPPP